MLSRGRYVVTPLFLLKYAPNGLSHNRYGFVVSTKVSKKAVMRNTIKRRMRAIARKYDGKGVKRYDIAFIVKKEIAGKPFAEIKDVMMAALAKIPQFL